MPGTEKSGGVNACFHYALGQRPWACPRHEVAKPLYKRYDTNLAREQPEWATRSGGRVSVYCLRICELILVLIITGLLQLTRKRAQSLFQLSFTILLRYRSVNQFLPSKMVLRTSDSFSCAVLLIWQIGHRYIRLVVKPALEELVIQLRGRSPLLPESLLMCSVSATEMFQFAGYILGNFFWA